MYNVRGLEMCSRFGRSCFSAVVEVVEVVEWRVTLVRTASMPSPDAAARHTGAGVARRQAHHERMRDERAREAAAGDAELPPEDDAVEMASAVHVLDSVAEVGPNYTLLRSKETKAKRRKRQREDARAALDGHTVLSTGSRLEIFCDSERWYPATVMAREEDGDGRIVHEVEYDGYPDRRWWHMLDDERWRAVAEQAGTGAGGAAADGGGDAAMDRADGERGARAAGDAEAAEARPAPPPVRRGVRRSALADALQNAPPGRYGTKASKMSQKSVSRVCCSPTAGARCQEAPLACLRHSLAPSECREPTRPNRLDAALAVGLQQSRRRACHRRRPVGGDGV